MNEAEADELPVSINQAMEGMPMRTENGRVLIGFSAIRRALRQTPIGFVPGLVLYLPGVSAVGRMVYEHVARNRRRDLCDVSQA